MSRAKLLINADGIEAQFRLIPDDDEREEGQIDDDDDEEEDDDNDDKEDQKDQNDCDDDKSNGGHAGKRPIDSPEDDDESKATISETQVNTTELKTKQDLSTPSKQKKHSNRISLFEMQSFVIALILPEPRLSTPPTWCRVIRSLKASNVGIFLLDNVDLDWIENKGSKFSYAFRFETSPNWIEQLTNIPLSNRIQSITMPREYGINGMYETDLGAKPKIPRTSLLLSPIQQVVENYPMPMHENIKMLRSEYPTVNEYSPLFSIDCEMCITDKSELTRISIVDEELRIVYNELVKPDEPITNYLTRYSGITKEMMEGVETTLHDVQRFIRKKLPKDSIFCGHSLNSDLSALQIYHPYVIDTSIIYNRAGQRSYKPSLKSLAYELLNKEIQTDHVIGHDSLEDAITTMELVKLKLVNGILFGDSVACEVAQGIKYDQKTGITHLQIDKFIERHDVVTLSYRKCDTTPGARCLYVHDQQGPLDESAKGAIEFLLQKENAICVVLTNSGQCYVKI